ncbi:uncharacterized protein NECHADRAFT_80984 [Fusarium vanettenii 77-13-4]|uniref:Uncharacterized protein n=1 Tax=Fusarium vanettenii (strain ATCC MYA-4622 / CBS 123669 / FGSC 9596 / NRRL 45880 / 77-13-4) TaxID=660122 RepID=C7ZGB2_FUSV7|nr:uncharacterized protein NECHADRAFT_80984 [Fusarium vanettenii 77-13-4]EEU36793.1 hypothetical protein NECHADRAFT_80984 [Fusarium vanettenii 77-13-4]
MSFLVTKGDTIHFTDSVLWIQNGSLDPTRLTIKWRQMVKDRTETYIRCRFTVSSSEKKGGELFIQANKLQTLVDKQGQDGPKYTVKIDDDFQYGQNEERTERFLVFHDKNNRPYQHRFVVQLVMLLGNQAIGWARSMGFDSIESLRDKAASIFGDYLRDF